MSAPQPASNELVALAAKARPEWSTEDVRVALAHAHYAAMSWGQVLAVMGRLMADPDAVPADLVHGNPEPWRYKGRGPGVDTYERGAAAARAALNAPAADDGP